MVACPLLMVSCLMVLPLPEAPVEGGAEVKVIVLARLKGDWLATVSDDQQLRLKVRGESIELEMLYREAVRPVWKGRLSLGTEQPDLHMDWVDLTSGEKKLPDNRCLFLLEGDVLIIIGGGPVKRPAQFYTGPGGEPKTLVFLRENF